MCNFLGIRMRIFRCTVCSHSARDCADDGLTKSGEILRRDAGIKTK